MKKIILFAIGILTSMTMMADPVKNYQYQSLTYEYNIDTREATLTFGGIINGEDYSKIALWTVEIPKFIKVKSNETEDSIQYKVTRIGNKAFQNNSEVNHIIIPDDVTTIEDSAFVNMSNLRLIDLPKNINTIEINAFKNCNNLAYIWCKNPNPSTISPSVFGNKDKCMMLYVPAEFTLKYEQKWTEVFEDRIYFGDMVIGNSSDGKQTYICAKNGSSGIATLYKWDNGVDDTDLPINASFTYKGVDYIVENIGSNVFTNPQKIKTVSIGYGIKKICNSAFKDCNFMRRITLPSTLDYIGSNAFLNCSYISHICCKVSDPFTLSEYSSRFPKNEMMTLYVPNSSYTSYTNGSYPWFELFKGRIYRGEMDVKTVVDSNNKKTTYIVATVSYEATLFEVIDKDIVEVQFEIPNNTTLTGIDRQAFLNCTKISSIKNIPNTVTAIGPDAFKKCSGLEEIKLPSSLKMIGAYAFSGCDKLVRVESEIQDLFNISDDLFTNANGNEKILYHVNSSFGSEEEFKGWKNGFTYKLKGTRSDITYPYKDEQGEHVYNMTFTSATGSKDAVLIKVSKVPNVSYDLNKIEVPNTLENNVSVIGIFKEAFSNVPNLDQLTFNDSIAGSLRIGKDALKGCPNLRILKLPSHLTELGSMAFSSNGKLAHILFKSYNNRTSIIGSDVFGNYTKNNATIYIPSANYYIEPNKGDLVEKGWNMNNIIVADILEEFNDTQDGMGMTYIGWKIQKEGAGTAKLIKGKTGTSNNEYIIPPTATSSKGNSYNVTAIAGEAFKSIGAEFKNLTISEGIKEIGISAFQGCSKIERVVLPTTLSKICESAFSGCNNLADIKPTSGEVSLKITEIGASAFYNCTSLEKITLPSTLESIGLNAFAGCSKLTEIESFIGTPLDIDETVFPNYSATLYVPCESRDAYLKAPVWENFTEEHISAGERIVIEDDGLKYVYASCGTTATLIKSDPIKNNLVIRDKIGSNIVVTEIAASALKDQKNIESVIIPEGVTSIGASAFENCIKLNKIELPKSLVSIGDQAFGNCGNIKMIISKIPAGNLEQLCSSIEKVFISDKAPTVKPSPDNIYIPVGINSKSIYTSQWKNIFEKKDNFIVGYPDFDKDEENQRKWRFNFLTTFDEENVTEEISASTLYGTATLIKAGYRGETDGNLILPDTVTFSGKRYQVTVIGDNAFNDYPEKSNVVTLKISENVDSIGKYAFNGFSEVKKIWLPSSLKLIKEWAFNGCNKITHVCSQMVNPQPMGDKLFPSIPTNNTATLFIPSEEGYNNDSWTKFSNLVVGTFVNDYKEDNGIIYSCYTNATGDTKAIVTKAETNYIKEALIKDSVTLGEFKEETNEKIYYKVTSIGKYAFQLCTQLETLELPLYLEAIGSKAFVNSPSIKTIISQVPGEVVGSLSDNITNVFSTPSPTPEKIYVPTDAVNPYKEAWKNLFTTDNTKYIVGYPGYDGKGENGWLYDYITVDNKAIEETQNTATLKKAIQSAADENHVLPIPSEVTINEKKYKVTKIGDNAFNGYEGKNSDVELNIPETITEIGKNAFNGFSKLEKVRLLSSLKSIGSMAFAGCGSITHVCSEMDSPTMGDDVFSTPSPTATFFVPTLEGYNTNILDKFPNVVVGKFDGEKHDGELKYSCYTDADGNPKAILTKSETSIQEALINDTVKISEEDYTVTTIGKNAFNGCAKLKKIELPSRLASIGNVPPVGENAFEECVILDEIVSDIKGDDLKPIPTNVFSEYTRNNAKLYVPDDASKAVYKNIDGWNVFKSSDPDNYIVGKWVESDVQNDYMKYRCHTGTLDAIVIGVDFPNDENVKDLIIKRNVPITIDGIGEKTYHVISIAPIDIKNKGRIQTISIIDNTTEENEATEPKTMAVANDAFKGCTSLKNVEFPSILTEIGANAFQGCSCLPKIRLPKSLTKIGSRAFNGCNSLIRVCIEAYPIMENTDAFSTYNKTLLFVPTGTLSTIDGETGWREFSMKYEGYYEDESPEGVERAYIYLKQADNKGTAILTKSLTSDPIDRTVEYGGTTYSVTIIGESAFSSASLVNLDLPETITKIEKKAFQNQRNLNTLNLSSRLESIGDDAFQGCNSLQNVVLPASLKSIGNRTFSDNTNLMDLTFSEGTIIESIGNDAFNNCTNLKKVLLPSTLTKIGSTAFDGCSNLTEVISHITNETVISDTNNTLSAPNAILYVPDGTVGLYEGWKPNFLCVLEGNQELGNYEGLKYAYTSKEMKAILIGVDKEKGIKDGAVTIPSTVTLGDNHVECEVIAIDKDAFKSIKTDVKIVTIGEKIKTIAEGAFDGCSNLAEIICKDFYKNINTLSQSDVILYVPDDDKKTDYVNAGWKSDHIYLGERKTRPEGGLLYAYATGGNEATLIGVTDGGIDKDGAVTISGSIKFKINDSDENDKEFKVVAIANSVFKDNTDVKLVSIGENIRSIGENAFDGCSNLKEVISKINDPSVVSSIPLSIPGAILYVPSHDEDLVTAYNDWNFSYTLVGERETAHENGLYYVCATVDKKAILIEGKIKEMKENVVIPGSISGYDVIAIYDNAFSGNSNIKTLKIDEKLNVIGVSAFQDCIALNKIWLPESLDSIADKAFYGCTDIDYLCTKRKTPLTVPAISKNAFPKFKSTSTLYIPYGSKEAYSNDTELGRKFSIIKEGTFEGDVCKSGLTYECITNDKNEKVAMVAKAAATVTDSEILNEVQIDNDETKFAVATIYKDAFKDCKNLKTVIFPLTLRTIEDKAFEQCTKLITITSRIKKDDLNGFNENVFPEDVYKNAIVYIPNDVETETKYKTTKGWEKFNNWAKGEKKTYVDNTNGMTYDYLIGVGTATLTGTTTDKDVVTIDGSVTIDDVQYTVIAIGESAFNKNPNKGKMVKLIISDNIETIGDNAFQGCNNLKMVWLPSTLKSIGNKAFDGCKSITRVSTKTKTMPSLGSEVFSTTTAYLFVPEGTESSWTGFAKVVKGSYVGDVTSDNISYICMETGDAAEKTAMLIKASKTASDFASSVELEGKTYSLTTIGESAFEDNTSIVNLVIPDGVKTIETNAFKNASKLRTVEFPASMESIGDNAFQGCNLAYIQSYIETPSAISDNVFADAVYSNATLFVSDNTSNNYNVDGWKKFTIVEGIYSEETIEDMTYLCVMSQDKFVAKLTKSLSKTKEVKVPAKIFIDGISYQVEGIEKSAFEGNSSLEKVIVAEGIKTISVAAFKQCPKLKSVVLPASLETIGDNAFESCPSIETVTCAGETPVDISKNVFSVTALEVNVPSRTAVKAYKEHTVWGAFEILYSMSSASGSDGTENEDVATYQLITQVVNGVTTSSVAIVDDDNVKGDFVIEATVVRNGIPCAVTTIAPSAFEGNLGLTSVSIPPTVTSIGTGAFAGCENLQSMTVNNTVPPTLISTFTGAGARRMLTRGADGGPIFKGVDVENCILYVPEESVEKYKASELWGVFKNIRAISATGMSGVIVPEGTPFDVYNLQGRKVRSSVTTLRGLTPGVYIVRGKKVAIK